jgi:hypothetical protein
MKELGCGTLYACMQGTRYSRCTLATGRNTRFALPSPLPPKRTDHRATLTLTDMFGAVDQSLNIDYFSPSPLAMSCEGLGLV